MAIQMILCPACKKKVSIEAQACPHCGQPIDDTHREKERQKTKAGKMGCLVLLALIFAIIILIALIPDDKKEATVAQQQPKQLTDEQAVAWIKKLDRRIMEVDYPLMQSGGHLVRIYYSEKDAWNESSFLFSSSDVFKKISESIINNTAIPDVDYLTFLLKAPVVDKYGNATQEKVMQLHFSATELRKVNWNNFTNWDFLNLLDKADLQPLGIKIVRAFCSEEDNGKYSREFCIRALSR